MKVLYFWRRWLQGWSRVLGTRLGLYHITFRFWRFVLWVLSFLDWVVLVFCWFGRWFVLWPSFLRWGKCGLFRLEGGRCQVWCWRTRVVWFTFKVVWGCWLNHPRVCWVFHIRFRFWFALTWVVLTKLLVKFTVIERLLFCSCCNSLFFSIYLFEAIIEAI